MSWTGITLTRIDLLLLVHFAALTFISPCILLMEREMEVTSFCFYWQRPVTCHSYHPPHWHQWYRPCDSLSLLNAMSHMIPSKKLCEVCLTFQVMFLKKFHSFCILISDIPWLPSPTPTWFHGITYYVKFISTVHLTYIVLAKCWHWQWYSKH